jgi:hypothetical protein
MSKAAQFEADERQRFVHTQPGQPLYPQVQQGMAQQYYAGQPVYAQPLPQQMLQAYPPNVVVINQVAPRQTGWRDPGCCTICWGVFLMIGALLSAGSAITALSAVNGARMNIPYPDWTDPADVTRYNTAIMILGTLSSVLSSTMASNIIMCVLTIAVVAFYCKKSTTPAARAWNYTCWILIALLQSGNVLIGVAISAVITTFGAVFLSTISNISSSLNQSGNGSVDPTGPLSIGVSVIAGVAWAITAFTAIPMIISSVVAHKNKARCSCSTTAPADYID